MHLLYDENAEKIGRMVRRVVKVALALNLPGLLMGVLSWAAATDRGAPVYCNADSTLVGQVVVLVEAGLFLSVVCAVLAFVFGPVFRGSGLASALAFLLGLGLALARLVHIVYLGECPLRW